MRGNIESRDRVELKPQLRDGGLRLSDDDQEGRPTAGHTLHEARAVASGSVSRAGFTGGRRHRP
jgi:hypothetical protein